MRCFKVRKEMRLSTSYDISVLLIERFRLAYPNLKESMGLGCGSGNTLEREVG